MTLKTLEDLIFDPDPLVNKNVRDKIKALAIKWVKEDMEDYNIHPATSPSLKRWMKRLNITSEDLKE